MFMVMSAMTYDGTSTNRKRCFELNAINLATEGEARQEANRRNAAEKAAGHDNVEWYACEQPTF